MRTKTLFRDHSPLIPLVLCWSLNFSLPAWKRMKSCYSSTKLATRVAFVVRKVGNLGEGNNSNFVFITGHLNSSFLTCKEPKRCLFFFFSPYLPPCILVGNDAFHYAFPPPRVLFLRSSCVSTCTSNSLLLNAVLCPMLCVHVWTTILLVSSLCNTSSGCPYFLPPQILLQWASPYLSTSKTV